MHQSDDRQCGCSPALGGHAPKRINKDGIQDIELEAKLLALVKLGEDYNLWNREGPPEISLVELRQTSEGTV